MNADAHQRAARAVLRGCDRHGGGRAASRSSLTPWKPAQVRRGWRRCPTSRGHRGTDADELMAQRGWVELAAPAVHRVRGLRGRGDRARGDVHYLMTPGTCWSWPRRRTACGALLRPPRAHHRRRRVRRSGRGDARGGARARRAGPGVDERRSSRRRKAGTSTPIRPATPTEMKRPPRSLRSLPRRGVSPSRRPIGTDSATP